MVGIINRSPSQNSFLEILNKNFPCIDTDAKEIYIGDFNINMYENNKYTVHENNTAFTKFASADAKKYHQFCTIHGLKQLIHCPARVTFSTSTLTDHILASFPSRVSQKGVINGQQGPGNKDLGLWRTLEGPGPKEPRTLKDLGPMRTQDP